MRDPKTYAKVLEMRLLAVRRACFAVDPPRAIRLWRLFNRLTVITRKHESATGWTYRPPEGGAPGKWFHTELDTEEDA